MYAYKNLTDTRRSTQNSEIESAEKLKNWNVNGRKKKRLTGANLDSSAGFTLECCSGAEADPLLTLLASFTSFFHDTMVVSPGRSSTVNIWRSPFFTNDDGGLDESPAPAPPSGGALSSAIGAVIDWRRGERVSRASVLGFQGELGREKHGGTETKDWALRPRRRENWWGEGLRGIQKLRRKKEN